MLKKFVFLSLVFVTVACGTEPQTSSVSTADEDDNWDLIPTEYRSAEVHCSNTNALDAIKVDVTLMVAEDEQTAVINGKVLDAATSRIDAVYQNTTLPRREQNLPLLTFQLQTSDANQAAARLELERYYLNGKMVGYIHFGDDKLATFECRYTE